MSAHPASVDVSALPKTTYGHRSIIWWATAAFMAMEGMTVAICVVSYLYLRRNWGGLPPARIPEPGLAWSLANLALMLVSFVPARLMERAAIDKDLKRLRMWLLVLFAFSVAFMVLRVFEFGELNTRWDTHAYGSAAWATLGFHASLLAVEVLEMGVMSAMAWSGHFEEKHFPDADDLALYWYYMILIWIPAFGVVFLLPRVM